MAHIIPTEEEVLNYFNTLSNWGRWGKEDELGAINFITPEKIKTASELVREGVTISCARPIVTDIRPDVSAQALRYMLDTGQGRVEEDLERPPFALEFIGMVFHGKSITHIDSPAHCFFQGKMYNGREADFVSAREGARANAVEALKNGVVTRGVLLDIDANGPIFPEDLEAAEKRQGVKIKSGDALLVKSGQPLHAASTPWLFEREVALIGTDTDNELVPSGYSKVPRPFHQITLVAMGLWLIDNMSLDALAAECKKLNQWEFLFTVSPLRLERTTGSPVNPITIF